MARVAFVFAGQGDQTPGMGKELWETRETAKAVYAMADRVRPGTSAQCFEGSEAELRETKNTQPCLYATELATARTLLAEGLRPEACAGFSLGEFAAAAVCGAFDDETGFRIVCERGRLMQEAAEKSETSMAAVLRLSADRVRELCEGFERVYPVNFNCPGQTTVAGDAEEMKRLQAAVREAGGRALPLKVRGAFHTPYLADAKEAFAAFLETEKLGKPETALYSDMTGRLYEKDPRKLLSEQMTSPVLWESIIRAMIADGIDTFVEIGPGRTLCNMISKIDGEVRVMTWKEALEETGC